MPFQRFQRKHRNTPRKYKQHHLVRDVIPLYTDQGYQSAPWMNSSPITFLNMPSQQPNMYQPAPYGPSIGNVVSDLTRAIDRQQMSSELQQLTNTLSQTMLNTLIFTKQLH